MTLDKASYRRGRRPCACASRRASPARRRSRSSATGCTTSASSTSPPTARPSTLPVKAEWGAGAYLVALAHRPLDQAREAHARALARARLVRGRPRRAHAHGRARRAGEDPPARRRCACRSRSPGSQPGEEARITVAAVDVGILNLTRYETPESGRAISSARSSSRPRSATSTAISSTACRARAARSAPAATWRRRRSRASRRPRSRSRATPAWCKVGPDGTAKVTFDIPAFNGTVRVMAVAWTTDRVGSASADVIVRDPVVLAGTLPRFLSVGDQSRFLMQIDNVEGPAGDYTRRPRHPRAGRRRRRTRCARPSRLDAGGQERRSRSRSRRPARARPSST